MVLKYCQDNDFGIELSSGCDITLEQFFDTFKLLGDKIRFHNYFPVSISPFVIDVASTDEVNRIRSINHVKKNILLTARLGLTYYSFHAGFATNPKPEELGKTFNKIEFSQSSREESKILFYESMKEIIDYAKKNNVLILVENNVVGNNNYINGLSVAHLSNHDEILDFFNYFSTDKVGLLLDTAHYLVSENSRPRGKRVDLTKVVELAPFTKVIHHSCTEDGVDRNKPLNNDYWFKPFIEAFKDPDHVLEIMNCSIKELNSSIYVLEK